MMPPLPTPRRFDKSSLRAWLLLLLRSQPGHGYDVIAALRIRGLPDPGGPALYRLLNELEDAGLVRSDWQSSAQGPERRVYRVTAKGTRQLRRDAEGMAAMQVDLAAFAGEYDMLSARLAKRRGIGRRARSMHEPTP